MDPRIFEIFKIIAKLEKEIDECLKNDKIFTAIRLEDRIQVHKNYIKDINVVLRNTIPEPWASMSADEIIKGLGVYR